MKYRLVMWFDGNVTSLEVTDENLGNEAARTFEKMARQSKKIGSWILVQVS